MHVEMRCCSGGGIGATVGRDDAGQVEQTEQQVAMGMTSRLP